MFASLDGSLNDDVCVASLEETMNCRFWNLTGRTFALVLCVCVLSASQANASGQETNLGELESASAPVNNKETRSNQIRPLATTETDAAAATPSDIQVAPSPKKINSTSASVSQKKRTAPKRPRKLNVPTTLGPTKSMRKNEKELDAIFTSRSKLAPEYIQYGPSANVASQNVSGVGSNENANQNDKTATVSKSLVTNAPYVEQTSRIQQASLLSPEAVEPTVSERYPLFEEDALTQESAPLIDELDFSERRSNSTSSDPFAQEVTNTTVKKAIIENEKYPTYVEATTTEDLYPFGTPGAVENRSANVRVKSSVLCENRFARYTGLFADFEWLGWQTDSLKQAYGVAVSEKNRVYDELSLRPSGSGYRGRAGLRTITGWDLTGAYTMFEADKDGNVAGNLYTSSGKAVDEISAKSKVKLDIYDVEVGRWITRQQWAARPFAGVRWTRANQTQNVDSWNNVVVETQMDDDACLASFDEVGSVPTTVESVVAQGVESVLARSKSDMYGVRIGAEGNVALFRNLSAYGKFAGVVGVGDVSWQTVSSAVQDGSSVIRRAKKSYATPSVETAIGLAWRRGGLEVKGGYEFNSWFNASSLNGKNSDFATRGLFAGLSWNN